MEPVLAIVIMQEPQSILEEKINPNILKDDFSSRTDPPIFTSIQPLLLDRSIQFQLLPQIRCLITLRIESGIISIDSNITGDIVRKVINL